MSNLPLLWATCVERLKDRTNNRSFWEAIEQTRPIAIDGDSLIIGVDPEKSYHIGVISQNSLQHIIATAVREVFGRELKFRVIDGVTVQEWEIIKDRDAKAAEARAAAAAKASSKPALQQGVYNASWDAVHEAVSRAHSDTPVRSLPQGKARYANEALYILAQAMETLYPDPPDEASERGVARILDRISHLSDIPAPVLAFELERLIVYLQSTAEEGEETV